MLSCRRPEKEIARNLQAPPIMPKGDTFTSSRANGDTRPGYGFQEVAFQNHRCVRIVAGLHSLEYILGPYLDVNSLCKVPQVRDKMCNYHLVIHARSEVRMAKIPKPTVTFGHAHLSSQNHMIVRFVLCCPDREICYVSC